MNVAQNIPFSNLSGIDFRDRASQAVTNPRAAPLSLLVVDHSDDVHQGRVPFCTQRTIWPIRDQFPRPMTKSGQPANFYDVSESSSELPANAERTGIAPVVGNLGMTH
ncbi:MAG: hypothetical protein CBB71_02620 [Rhodopirellula sp. TMED11]|nr:MAG: hypothetical protein CBB71_02620 [Rhodopirellula sp. TMED11]